MSLLCNCPSDHLSFSFNTTAATEIYTLSLHDALPISRLAIAPRFTLFVPTGSASKGLGQGGPGLQLGIPGPPWRSEEHTSELQSRRELVCRLLLEKKKQIRLRPLLRLTLEPSLPLITY